MKNRLLSTLFLAILIAFSACNKEAENEKGNEEQTIDSTIVKIGFAFVYGDEDFELNKVFNYDSGYDLKFELINLYVANMRLINDKGNAIDGPEITFVKADSSNNEVSVKVPVGNYESIEFAIGVPPNLNGTDNPDFDAALYDPDHPLSLTNAMYWTWNAGYRFIRMDGRLNQTPMEDDEFETLISIHTGKDYSFRSTSLAHQFNAVKDQPVELILTFDVAGFLDNPDDMIDLTVDNQTHGENAYLANRVSDNAIKSVEIK